MQAYDPLKNMMVDVEVRVKDASEQQQLKEIVSQYCHVPASLVKVETDNAKEIIYVNMPNEVVAKYNKRSGRLLVVNGGKTKDADIKQFIVKPGPKQGIPLKMTPFKDTTVEASTKAEAKEKWEKQNNEAGRIVKLITEKK
jgi:CO dehydrogenase/acetyl-CoA synthase epsilon subunit